MSDSPNWVMAAYSPVIPGTRVHASVATPFVAFVVNISWTTFFCVLIAIITAVILQTKGRTFTWVFRRLMSKLRGQIVWARPIWYRRRFARMESYESIEMN